LGVGAQDSRSPQPKGCPAFMQWLHRLSKADQESDLAQLSLAQNRLVRIRG